MKELIRYLADLECTAGTLYADAAEYFTRDRELSLFLKDLEQDEIHHYDMMNHISDLLAGNAEDLPSDIFIDPRAWKRLEEPLMGFRNQLVHGTLTRERLFDYLTSIEFSEWNNIFIYIIEVLKGYYTELHPVEGQLENHMNKIRNYIARKPALKKHGQGVKDVRSVHNVRILVIDDEAAMLNLLESYLSTRYQVDCATDGEAALKKLSSGHYDVIISDVHMPGSSGIDMYNEAITIDKSLEQRFIFITGDTSAVYKKFFEENRIPYLYKPVSLDLIEDRIREVLKRS